MKRLAMAFCIPIMLLSMAACDDRECVRGHYTTVIMPIIMSNGSGGTTTMYVPQQVWHCDEYAPASTEG